MKVWNLFTTEATEIDLLLPLVLCTLAVCCGARSPPGPPPLLPRGCNDSDVLAASDLALQDINKDQRKGFVLSLNRVSNVYEHRQASDLCTSCGSQGLGTQRHMLAGAFQIGNPAEDAVLCSARVCYVLLLLLGTNANSILL